MTLLQSIFMGFIQGMTEFLPVSSSGHLALFRALFNINTDTGIVFDILLHLGTLLAIFVVYYKDIWELICNGFGLLYDIICNFFIWIMRLIGKDKSYHCILSTPYRRFVLLIIISTIPTGIMGVIGKDFVESASSTALIPGICLIITSILLFISDRISEGQKNATTATYKNSIFVGISQGFATLPGLSRSGTTITACLLCGFEREFAVKYSFIMSIPAVLGAAVLELKDISQEAISHSDMINYLAGMAVAAIVGYICIKTMLVIVRNKKFTFFSIYCLIVGIIAIAASLA